MNVFQSETIRGITVITLSIQSLDSTNAGHVLAVVGGAMPKSALIVLDLGALRYFDVAGFAVILKWAAEPAVRLCSRAKTVHALSDLLQAETVITIFQSREEALASLRGLETSRRRTALSPENRDDRVPSRRTA